MDGLCRCVPVRVEIVLRGRTFRVRPLTLADIASAEMQILVSRPSRFDQIEQFKDCRAELFDMAVADVRRDKAQRVVRQAELTAWLDTVDGVVFSAMRCLRPKFPTSADTKAFLDTLTPADIRSFLRARDMVSGMDMLAHLDWPPGDGKESAAGIPWRRLTRWFADEHHWGPDQVGRLTLYQLRVLRADEKELGGRARLSPGEAFSYRPGVRHDPQTMPARQSVRKWFASTTRAERMKQREKRGKR